MNNSITVHGKVGQEPELRFTPSGMAVIEFSLADTYGKDDKKKTTWHNCVAFGQLAENIAATAQKGATLIVVGRLEQDEYTKKDGSKGKTVKLVVDECGASLRWNVWVQDRTDKVMAEVGRIGKPVPAPSPFEADEEPF
jgi:single-strand DNA-binding protein